MLNSDTLCHSAFIYYRLVTSLIEYLGFADPIARYYQQSSLFTVCYKKDDFGAKTLQLARQASATLSVQCMQVYIMLLGRVVGAGGPNPACGSACLCSLDALSRGVTRTVCNKAVSMGLLANSPGHLITT